MFHKLFSWVHTALGKRDINNAPKNSLKFKEGITMAKTTQFNMGDCVQFVKEYPGMFFFITGVDTTKSDTVYTVGTPVNCRVTADAIKYPDYKEGMSVKLAPVDKLQMIYDSEVFDFGENPAYMDSDDLAKQYTIMDVDHSDDSVQLNDGVWWHMSCVVLPGTQGEFPQLIDPAKKMWLDAINRYAAIAQALNQVDANIREQADDLNIPKCSFCQARNNGVFHKCKNCPWGKKFGVCGKSDSRWAGLKAKMDDLNEYIVQIITDARDYTAVDDATRALREQKAVLEAQLAKINADLGATK